MINRETKQRTSAWWKKSLRYKRLKDINPTLPTGKYTKVISTLTRKQTSILTQLCTGHAPIFSHLHRIGQADMPICLQDSCSHTIEDIHYLLFICLTYTHPQFQLIHKLGKGKFSLPRLLTNAKTIPHTIAYLNSTSCFKHIFGNLCV